MPTYTVDGITWNYTVSGSDATIGNDTSTAGNATTSNISGAITIPDTVDGYTVTAIGKYSFKSFSGLTSITIPDSVITISNNVFQSCTGLTSITIPASVITIGNSAFMACSGLTSITIPASVITIGTYTFYNCTGLVSITIPDSVTSIGTDTFLNTSANLVVTMNTKTIDGTTYTSPTTTDIAFFGNPSVTLVVPPPPLAFVNNILTIENSINATDTDSVSFVLPAGEEIPSLNVTNFVGTGTISYTISTTGATDITGTISVVGDNLLADNLLVASAGADITYTLTLTTTASAAITYTIEGTKVADYSANNTYTVEREYPPAWVRTYILDNTAAKAANSEWTGTDVSFTVTDPNESYGQGTYTFGCSSKRDGGSTGSNHNMTTTFDGDLSPYLAPWLKGWYSFHGTQLTNPNNVIGSWIDLENGNATGNEGTAALTIEFPESFQPTKFKFWGNNTQSPTPQYLYGYDEANSRYDKLHYSSDTWTSQTVTSVEHNITQTTPKSYKKYAITSGNNSMQIWPEIRLTGRVTITIPPTTRTFTNNILTIENSIDSNDTDVIDYVLPIGYEMGQLTVTSFSGTGTINYTLATGGTTITTGAFTSTGTNLLDGILLNSSIGSTYALTLTAPPVIPDPTTAHIHDSILTDTYILGGSTYYLIPQSSPVAISGVSIDSLDKIEPSSALITGEFVSNTFNCVFYKYQDANGSIVPGNWVCGHYDTALNITRVCRIEFTLNGTTPSIQQISRAYNTNFNVSDTGSALGNGNYTNTAADLAKLFNDTNVGTTATGDLKYALTDFYYNLISVPVDQGVTTYTIIGTKVVDYGTIEYINPQWTNLTNTTTYQTKLKATNAGPNDTFGGAGSDGKCVAISGDYAIIGAINEDSGATGDDNTTLNTSGAAYIFERDANGTWGEKQKLKASNAASSSKFGWSVAISGDYAIVGATEDDSDNTGVVNGSTSNAGAAYIFERETNGTWTQVTRILKASTAVGNDKFGWRVAINANYAMVSAPFEDTPITSTGAVYSFKRQTDGTWGTSFNTTVCHETQIIKTTDSSGLQLGRGLVIYENRIIVGATGDKTDSTGTNTGNHNYSGAAFIFELVGDTWTELTLKLKSSNAQGNDYLGATVDINDKYAIVGATGEDTDLSGNVQNGMGAVYVFELANGVWGTLNNGTIYNETKKLKASNAFNIGSNLGFSFGNSVSLSGNTVLVGSFQDSCNAAGTEVTNSQTGSAYIFERATNGTWGTTYNATTCTETKRIVANDAVNEDKFGTNVGLSGNYAIISSPNDDSDNTGNNIDGNHNNSGAAYIIEPTLIQNILPTTLVFSNNILTIDNVISTTDTDVIDFVLPAGYNIPELNVTNFNGTGNVNYTLTTGGNTVVSGSFAATSTDLLAGIPIFVINADTTYTLSMTADASISYTIVGTSAITNFSSFSITQLLGGGYTEQNLIDDGKWNADFNANRFDPTYINGFLDISGGNVIVSDNILLDTGDIELNSMTYTQPYTFSADVSMNSRLFVIGDVSMGDASLNIVGDLSLNGIISVNSYKPASISVAAIAAGSGYSTAHSITTFTEDIAYSNKIDFKDNTTEYAIPYVLDMNAPNVFVSTDAKTKTASSTVMSGQNWTDIEMSSTGQYLIAVVGGNNSSNGYNYVAVTGNVWISNDYGANWTENTVGGGAKQWAFAMISGDGSVMMVKANGNNLWRSTNYGVTWSQVSVEFTDLTYSSTIGRTGLPMKMAYDGLHIYGLRRMSIENTSNGEFIYTYALQVSDDGGVNWIPRGDTNGQISSYNTSKSGQYIIIIYTNGVMKPKYSDDYGVTFFTLTNGPIVYLNNNYRHAYHRSASCISNNGKVCYENWAQTALFHNIDVTSGTVTNGENDAVVTTVTGSVGQSGGECYGMNSSNDGKYILYYGYMQWTSWMGPTSGYLSTDYGASFEFHNMSGHLYQGGISNYTNHPADDRIFGMRFSDDNKYVAIVREKDNIYVHNTHPLVLNPTPTVIGSNTISFNKILDPTINAPNIFKSNDVKTVIPQKWQDIEISSTGQYMVAVVGGGDFPGNQFWNGSIVTGNVWVSIDFGQNWREIVVHAQKQWISAMISGDGSVMMVKARGDELWRSTDYGEHWQIMVITIPNKTYADIINYGDPGVGINGIPMKMASDGQNVSTYYCTASNLTSVNALNTFIKSTNGGTTWTETTSTYGKIQCMGASKSGKYIVLLYFDDSTKPKYSDDYGETFITLTNGPASTAGSWSSTHTNAVCISNTGKICIKLANSEYLRNMDVTAGTVTGIAPNEENSAQQVTSNFSLLTTNSFVYILNSSNDGRYIIMSGGLGYNIVISTDYGVNFNAMDSNSAFTTAINSNQVWGCRFSDDNKYIAVVQNNSYIYVYNTVLLNPNSTTYFGANTTLKANNGIQLPDSTTLHTTNKEANGTTVKASTFNNMTVIGDFASNPLLTPSDYRIKTNVETLDETHTLDNLRPVKYKQTQTGKNDIGFLAHELQEHYPELVEGEKDGEKMQSVNYMGLLPVLINEVQQLKKQIAETRDRIRSENN